ncbi:MAG: hypothetical protein CMC18_07260 [Flavobacteriaceae bacterium]|nr:hypothetical protein [Flavobacteriaceae bacterium]
MSETHSIVALQEQLNNEILKRKRIEFELSVLQKNAGNSSEINIFNDIASKILGVTKYEEIAWNVLNSIANYLKCDDCIFYLVDTEQEVLTQIAAFGEKMYDGQIVNLLTIPIGDGIVGTVAKTGEPELIHDTSKDERYILDINHNNSEITVPVIVEGRIIGIIDSEAPPKNYFNQEQLETLNNIAQLIAAQLDNAIYLRKLTLAEQQMHELYEKLVQRNKELEQYAHVVSHDLKSPLRSMSALFHWIKEDTQGFVNEETANHISLIENSIEYMENMISNILSYSSIDINFTSFDKFTLQSTVDKVILGNRIPDHITLKLAIEPDLELIGNKTHFEQLIQNILSNAFKYADVKKGIVKITGSSKVDNVLISVEDNGNGVNEKYQKKIFEIFQTLGHKHDSTGVGLAICKKIVDLYQGKIWIDNGYQEGARFVVEFPKP